MRVFEYTGADLIAPLSRLLKHLLDELNELSKDEKKYRENCIHAIRAIRETELFLFEAKRSPEAKWGLSMEELARLYPVQVAHETMAAVLLSKL